MSLKSTIGRIPLRELLKLHRFIRSKFFSIRWPSHAPSVESSLPPEQVEKFLRQNLHFEGGKTFSYQYRGEVMNIRRPEEVEDGIQMQFHLRARKISDGLYEYAGHLEPDPDEFPVLHIKEVGFRWNREKTEEILSEVS